jgi:hypothetical protein
MVCSACGAANAPGQRFCDQCGGALTTDGPPQVGGVDQQEAPTAVAERRFVSVLFADLVGFTAASERRDAEDTRELLSRYFEISRRLIELYGGSVEKFIGDAVMAVWGAPVATEDDAERAVRAALELVAAVQAMGEEVGVPELQARAAGRRRLRQDVHAERAGGAVGPRRGAARAVAGGAGAQGGALDSG